MRRRQGVEAQVVDAGTNMGEMGGTRREEDGLLDVGIHHAHKWESAEQASQDAHLRRAGQTTGGATGRRHFILSHVDQGRQLPVARCPLLVANGSTGDSQESDGRRWTRSRFGGCLAGDGVQLHSST